MISLLPGKPTGRQPEAVQSYIILSHQSLSPPLLSTAMRSPFEEWAFKICLLRTKRPHTASLFDIKLGQGALVIASRVVLDEGESNAEHINKRLYQSKYAEQSR
jgi:hypothetical protein